MEAGPDERGVAATCIPGADRQCLLALDLGRHLGWAQWNRGVVTTGSIDLGRKNSKRFESPSMKFIRFTRALASFPTPTLVNFEEVRRHLGVDAAHAYGGYLSHLTVFCDEQTPPIPYEGVPVSTIKRRATGNGAANKDMMIASCRDVLGRDPTDDNEADATWLLVIMCEAAGVPWPNGPVPTFDAPKRAKTRKKKQRRRFKKKSK